MRDSSFRFKLDQPWLTEETIFVDCVSRTIAIFCSDGRFGDANHEFLKRRLGISPDLIVKPGGAANLLRGRVEPRITVDEMVALARLHKTTKIIITAHYGCNRYRQQFPKISDDGIKTIQLQDLVKIKHFLAKYPVLPQKIQLVYIQPENAGGHVNFSSVEEDV